MRASLTGFVTKKPVGTPVFSVAAARSSAFCAAARRA
jgi:hypothetical protein